LEDKEMKRKYVVKVKRYGRKKPTARKANTGRWRVEEDGEEWKASGK
jgi:hypothetical protein